ncbi:hypothetical protein ACFLUS_04980, partial [Chloroflexota bacterium]
MPKRGPKIRPRIKALIHVHALEEPRLPRDAVAMRIKEEIERMGEIPPSEETLVKMVSRERNREPNPLDEPWSLGMMSKYKDDFTPEIVPVLIDIEKLQMFVKYDAPKERLTVRHAQWIARLYHLIKEIYMRRYPEQIEDALNKPVKEYLWMFYVIADVYAKMEEMKEIIGEKHIDISELDKEYFITEEFWDLPWEEKPYRHIATKMLYKMVLEDHRVKKVQNQDTSSDKEVNHE